MQVFFLGHQRLNGLAVTADLNAGPGNVHGLGFEQQRLAFAVQRNADREVDRMFGHVCRSFMAHLIACVITPFLSTVAIVEAP